MVSLSWATFAGHPLGQSKHWHLACSSGNEVLKVGKNFGGPGCGPNTKFDLWKDQRLTRPWEPGAQVEGCSQESAASAWASLVALTPANTCRGCLAITMW